MPRPPFAVPACVRSSSAGEYELQDWHGERNHSHADDRPGGNHGGCGAFVPVVGFQDDDVRGWRQDRKDE